MKKIKIALSILIIIFIAISCGKSPTEAGDELPSNVLKYSEKQVYLKGDFVYHNGSYYQATTRIVAKDPAQYSITSTAPLNPWKKSTIGEVNSALTTSPGSASVVVVAKWEAKTYIGGDIVKGSDGKYYKAMWWTTGNDPAKAENQNGGGNWGPWQPISKEDAEKELGYTAGNANGGNTTNNEDRNEGTIEEDTTVPPEVKPEDKVTVEAKPEFQTKYAWSDKKVYLENHVAIYNGVYYKAKWWTQGNSPSAAIDNAWDTPWQKISEAVFEALANGTPAVQPPNDSPAAPIPPPIVSGGGSTTTPPPSGGNDGTGAGGFSSVGHKWAIDQGYKEKWAYNNAPAALKAKLDAADVFNKYGIDGSKAVDTFKAALSENQWNQLFRQALAGNGLSSYYSYANFTDALKIIGKYVYIVVRPTASSWTQKCYVVYKGTGKDNAEVRLVFEEGEDFTPAANSSYTIIDYAAFGTEGSDNDKKRVIAGFLAHASHETSGSWNTAPAYAFNASLFPNATFAEDMVTGTGASAELNGMLAWSLWFNEEVAYKSLQGAFYVDSYNKVFPPYVGANGRKASSYHGRGAFQLSWNYNYGLASAIFFGDARVLNKYPEFIVDGVPAAKIVEAGFNAGNWQPNGSAQINGGTMAFLTSLMFWLTPQGAKPSQQDTMILNTENGKYNSTTTLNLAGASSKKAKLPAVSSKGQPGYGWTINIMNGGFEAGKSWNGANADLKVRRRVLHYKLFVAAMGGTIDPTEKLDTVGNHQY